MQTGSSPSYLSDKPTLRPSDEKRVFYEQVTGVKVCSSNRSYSLRKANQQVVDTLDKIAESKKATRAQIAPAWLLAQKAWIVPIPGTTKLHRLEENLGATDVGFSAEDLKEIENAFSGIEVPGERYPETLQTLIG